MFQLLYLLVAAAVVLAVFALLRSGHLREKYAALWVFVGVSIVILACAPGILAFIAHALGFVVPSNFLFVLAIFLLLGVTLHHSLELTRLEDETRTLAENVAILNTIVAEAGLEDRLRATGASHPEETSPAEDPAHS